MKNIRPQIELFCQNLQYICYKLVNNFSNIYQNIGKKTVNKKTEIINHTSISLRNVCSDVKPQMCIRNSNSVTTFCFNKGMSQQAKKQKNIAIKNMPLVKKPFCAWHRSKKCLLLFGFSELISYPTMACGCEMYS